MAEKSRRLYFRRHNGLGISLSSWTSLFMFALYYLDKVDNEKIKSNIDANNVVIMNVNSGGH